MSKTDFEILKEKYSGDKLDQAIWDYFRQMNPIDTVDEITHRFESYTGRKYTLNNK